MIRAFTLHQETLYLEFLIKLKVLILIKYTYSGNGIGFDADGSFSLSSVNGFGKNVIISGVNKSSFVHADNRKKYIWILFKCLTDGLDHITITVEAIYSINFTEQENKFCLSIYYNGSNICLFVNRVNIYQLKQKTVIHSYPLRLGNISKDVNMKKLDYMGMCMVFQLIIIILMLMMFWIGYS